MKRNQDFEELVRYLDTDLKDVLNRQQREHIYALTVRSTVNAQRRERRHQATSNVEIPPFEMNNAERTKYRAVGWMGVGAVALGFLVWLLYSL